jgi:hypothetical protein
VNGGMSGLRMRSGWCGLRRSSGGWGPADTDGVQEALDALQTHAVGCGERGGGGAVAVGGDQVRDLALTEAVTQAPRMLRATSRCYSFYSYLLMTAGVQTATAKKIPGCFLGVGVAYPYWVEW